MSEKVENEVEMPANNVTKPTFPEMDRTIELGKRDVYEARITQTKLHLLELQTEISQPSFKELNPLVKSIIENEINITEAYYHVLEMKLLMIKN